ncbi:fatty acyl-AMP ligase [Streptomyces monomycini]|uniref:fatty acyl-AMP ligase n=1 Tax=Streptomyces monomycini TaxID=371720 RepID=UPI00067AAC9A|nr:fatty acyl-AMP ligase [Streptomyces monomycini]
MKTFVDCLRQQAARHGDTRGYVFVEDRRRRMTETGRLTYGGLDRQAMRLGAGLVEDGLADHPVLLLYPAGLPFLSAFFGCLYARAIAVPAPLPDTDPRALERAENIINDAGIRLVLTDTAHAQTLRRWLAEAGLDRSVRLLATDASPAAETRPDQRSLPAVRPETTAYLQYTSGSTGEPRGVIVSHGNLLHNSRQIHHLLGSPRDGWGAGWLPHYHDMGLVGQLLQPLYTGANMALASPVAFVARPPLWLEMISHYRARATMAPNFAYEWLARTLRDEHLRGLDLSCLEWALNGAEPLRASTLDKLTERLGPAGFRRRMWAPAYGLAEATLLVTGTPRDQGPRTAHFAPTHLEQHRAVRAPQSSGTELISSGHTVDTDLLIVDPHTHIPVADGHIGEVWVAGPSVAQGYWRRSAATEETFHACTRDRSGPFLRTGDLGFLADGELFVTGRLKELMIVNGRNLYPQDIEEAAHRVHPAAGAAAAFSVTSDGEHIVLVQEVRPNRLDGLPQADLAARIRRHTKKAAGCPVSVLLVERNAVPRTTSGKIRRLRAKSLLLADELPVLHADVHSRLAPLLPTPTAQSTQRPDPLRKDTLAP